MKRWWTADIHFDHSNINIHCNRPWLNTDDINPETKKFISSEAAFDCANRMNKALIHNINSRVKPKDNVVHVGDFCMHSKMYKNSNYKTPMELISILNGHWTLLKGNHDKNNHVKYIGHILISKIGRYNVIIRHEPFSKDEIKNFVNIDFVICGHVHEAWHTKFIDGLWHINVGVDINKYIPIDDNKIIELFEKSKRNKIQSHNSKII